jgi:dTDP-4-amino-4,6-dideoxygalactose transaminase
VIPLYKVSMPANIAEILKSVLLGGFITEGPRAKQFEQEFQKYVGNKYTAVVNSGTSAITLALRLAGVGPGTEVISSPNTCLATNSPILTLGADVVWCDVDVKTGNIDADKIEALITEKTKAILFVNWGGTPAELDKINSVAKKHGLKTIEDAAQSLGALYRGCVTGTGCDFTCFSFQAIKHLTTVDGGAISCRNKKDYDEAVLLRWFGLRRGHSKSPVCWEGDVFVPGYKMHMNDVNATIGLEQLKYVDSIIKAHKYNGAFLTDALKSVHSVEICEIPLYIDSSFWFYTIKLDNQEHRAKVNEGLAVHGIGSGISHTRNDKYSIFKEYSTELPGVTEFDNRKLNIPCGWWVTEQDLEVIVKTLKKVS